MSPPPEINELIGLFTANGTLLMFGCAALIAAALRKLSNPSDEPEITGIACLLLALIPAGTLFLVSRATPIHMFVARYCLVAIPGIALCWGLLFNRIRSRLLYVAFAMAILLYAANAQLASPSHGYSWKAAISAANAATAADRAPVLICSDLPESDSERMPRDPLESGLWSPLSYYKLNSPFVPLPRALNDEARLQIQNFLSSNSNHRRFLALAFGPSWPTLRWIADQTKNTYTARTLGVYDGVAVIEYSPR